MVDTAGDVMRWARSRVGTVIKSKYRLDDVIGAGGMAVVFRATHRNQAEFAVKMLLPELSFRKDLVTRFLREGYAANSVKHSGVVQVVDDDIADDGAAFLVMELLHGTPVESLWLKQAQHLPVQVAVAIVDQLLEVLAAAHAKNIIHRDIKPANLFLTSEGVVKVLDFGIARVKDAMASGAQGTSTGMLLGTPAFMAPEQAKAQSHAIDAQTDLWAAGATLFTLVTGRFVHDGDNAPQLLINTATTAARPISSVSSDVPPPIAAVVDRALAFEKAARWPAADAMRDALRQAYQATYGALPTPEILVSPPPSTSPPVSSLPAAPPVLSLPAAQQLTVPLTPVVSSERRMVGATTAQPISRQPSYDLPVTRSRTPVWIGLVAVVTLIGAGTALFVHNKHAAAPVVVDQPSAAAPHDVPSPATATAVLPTTIETAPKEPTPSATTVVSAPPAHTAPLQHVVALTTAASPSTHPTATHPAVAPTTPTGNCNPPYYFDAQNRKIFKKECL